jgi:hypothetical protein
MTKYTTAQSPGAVDPGYTTTEFWQTVFVHLVAAVVALGTVFNPRFSLNGAQAIIPALAVGASAVAQLFYSRSRATVKAAAQSASSNVATAAITSGAATSPGTTASDGSSRTTPVVVNFAYPVPNQTNQ